MGMERIGMRKIKEVLRLKYEGKVPVNKIMICCDLSRTTVKRYLFRFKHSGLTWPLPPEITDEILDQKLFAHERGRKIKRAALNYEYLIYEMKRPNVTLILLWEEYKQTHPEGYSYAQFCNLYHAYVGSLNYSMRQEHKAGEKTFVDFGSGLSLINPLNGELIPTSLFVSVWGASHYMFAEAVLREDMQNWIEVNVSALEFYGCCPLAIVPDNPKVAVIKACRYEPEINPTYADFAQHYGVAIFPARPHRPKDKPKVENGVRLAKRWILAKLRNHIFHSLLEMNQAILELLKEANQKPMKRLKKSRQELFELWDKPNAQPLPSDRYELAEWKRVKVNLDYHVSFNDHYYSVPYTLIHQELEIRATRRVIEVLKKGERICSHLRSYQRYKYTTLKEHMPRAHQQYLEWTPSRILEWAGKYGTAVKTLIEKIMEGRAFPEQAYRACLGIIRLEDKYSAERLNQACMRALEYQVHSYRGVKDILFKGLDRLDGSGQTRTTRLPVIQHENIRGAKYFEKEGIAEPESSLKSSSNRMPMACLEKTLVEKEPKIETALIVAH